MFIVNVSFIRCKTVTVAVEVPEEATMFKTVDRSLPVLFASRIETIIFLLPVPFNMFSPNQDGVEGEKVIVHAPFDTRLKESDAFRVPVKERLERLVDIVVCVGGGLGSELGVLLHPNVIRKTMTRRGIRVFILIGKIV